MWKLISTVVAVVFLAAAGFLFWDGRQAADDAAAAHAEAKSLDAQTLSTKVNTKRERDQTTTLEDRAHLVSNASNDMNAKAVSIETSVDRVVRIRNDVISTVNPIVNQSASPATRARLNQLLQDLADAIFVANGDADRLRGSAGALKSVAR
jgi:cytoskeletal protein RodZ